MYDKVINWLNGCTFVSCIIGSIMEVLGFINTFAPALTVIIAFVSFLVAWHYQDKRYKLMLKTGNDNEQ